jgi:hypothetical protein
MTARPSDAAFDAAAQIYVDALATRDSKTPRQAAEDAYVTGGPTVEELEAEIRAQRAEPRTGAA